MGGRGRRRGPFTARMWLGAMMVGVALLGSDGVPVVHLEQAEGDAVDGGGLAAGTANFAPPARVPSGGASAKFLAEADAQSAADRSGAETEAQADMPATASGARPGGGAAPAAAAPPPPPPAPASEPSWGEHRLRIRDDCTPEERAANWGYVLERGQVRSTTIYWDQRVAPGPTCEYAQVIQTPAFAPEFRKVVSDTPVWMNHWSIAYFGHSGEGQVLKSEMCEWAMCDVPDTWMYWHPKLAFVTSTVSRELGLGDGSPVTVCARELRGEEMYQATSRYGDRCDCQLMFQAEQDVRAKFRFMFDPFTNNCRDYIAQVLDRCIELQIAANATAAAIAPVPATPHETPTA